MYATEGSHGPRKTSVAEGKWLLKAAEISMNNKKFKRSRSCGFTSLLIPPYEVNSIELFCGVISSISCCGLFQLSEPFSAFNLLQCRYCRSTNINGSVRVLYLRCYE